MRAPLPTAVSLILLLVLLATGVAPAPAALAAASGPPPCCAHDEAEPDTVPACPTGECPHCAVLSMEVSESVTGRTILDVRLQRFLYAGSYPPEAFSPPLEYPPKA